MSVIDDAVFFFVGVKSDRIIRLPSTRREKVRTQSGEHRTPSLVIRRITEDLGSVSFSDVVCSVKSPVLPFIVFSEEGCSNQV